MLLLSRVSKHDEVIMILDFFEHDKVIIII
jgi:hypothetical protein